MSAASSPSNSGDGKQDKPTISAAAIAAAMDAVTAVASASAAPPADTAAEGRKGMNVTKVSVFSTFTVFDEAEFHAYEVECNQLLHVRSFRCPCKDAHCAHIAHVKAMWDDGKFPLLPNPKANRAYEHIVNILKLCSDVAAAPQK